MTARTDVDAPEGRDLQRRARVKRMAMRIRMPDWGHEGC